MRTVRQVGHKILLLACRACGLPYTAEAGRGGGEIQSEARNADGRQARGCDVNWEAARFLSVSEI